MAEYFEDYFIKVKDASSFLKNKISMSPELAVVLTGGVEGPVNELTDIVEVSASEIPNFPTARAQGHEGKLYFGKLNGSAIVVLRGRYHYYEGHLAQDVVFPYFVLKELGVKSLITTNAVGGIRQDLDAGDIMMITDHINSMGTNPLRGVAIQRDHDQFTDMTKPYSQNLQKIAKEEAKNLGLNLKEGVYLSTPGPSYETKTEIKMFRGWGADAVGMSTVLEVIACNFLGINVLAFCCIANPAADRHVGEMSHEIVLKAIKAAGPKLSDLTSACVKKILK